MAIQSNNGEERRRGGGEEGRRKDGERRGGVGWGEGGLRSYCPAIVGCCEGNGMALLLQLELEFY